VLAAKVLKYSGRFALTQKKLPFLFVIKYQMLFSRSKYGRGSQVYLVMYHLKKTSSLEFIHQLIRKKNILSQKWILSKIFS